MCWNISLFVLLCVSLIFVLSVVLFVCLLRELCPVFSLNLNNFANYWAKLYPICSRSKFYVLTIFWVKSWPSFIEVDDVAHVAQLSLQHGGAVL